jgi:hypothetical protein
LFANNVCQHFVPTLPAPAATNGESEFAEPELGES